MTIDRFMARVEMREAASALGLSTRELRDMAATLTPRTVTRDLIGPDDVVKFTATPEADGPSRMRANADRWLAKPSVKRRLRESHEWAHSRKQ